MRIYRDHSSLPVLPVERWVASWREAEEAKASRAPLPALVEWVRLVRVVGMAVATDEALIADFRARSGTVYHPSCTCRMGAAPATSVVDARLRVHGVPGLRVIDASAFPNLIAGNTNAPAMLMGWKGAELVLADAR